jgi:hypothetical protein
MHIFQSCFFGVFKALCAVLAQQRDLPQNMWPVYSELYTRSIMSVFLLVGMK